MDLMTRLKGFKVLSFCLLTMCTGQANAWYMQYLLDDYSNFCPIPLLKDGLYIGVQAGSDNYRIREDIRNIPDGTLITKSTMGTSANGPMGGVFLGYGRFLTDLYYLGIEAFINVSGARQTVHFYQSSSQLSAETKYWVQREFGASILPGFWPNNSTLLYVRIGYSWAHMKTENILTFPLSGVSESLKLANGRKGGLQLGIGAETLLAANLSMRLDYNYVTYKSLKTAQDITIGSFKYRASNSQISAALIYHFC